MSSSAEVNPPHGSQDSPFAPDPQIGHFPTT
jgi:hypothetical protein